MMPSIRRRAGLSHRPRSGCRSSPPSAARVDRRAVRVVASLRLIRQLARLYGARPGALGMIRLMRHVIAHPPSLAGWRWATA